MPVIRITSTQLNQILSFFSEFVSSCISIICIHVSSADTELAVIITFMHLLSLEDKIWDLLVQQLSLTATCRALSSEVPSKSQPSLMWSSVNLRGYSLPPLEGFQVGREEKTLASDGNIGEEMDSESHYLELQGRVDHKERENGRIQDTHTTSSLPLIL